MKNQLIFDITDADTIAASDSVGAYVRGHDGTLIEAVDVGGVDSLAVAVQGTVPVSATNLDIRDLAFATDKVDVSGSEVSLDAATLAALESITVSATDLDIRDLDAAQDSVQANMFDGSGNALTSTAGALDVNITSPLSIDVNLTQADEVTVFQGTDPWIVSATDLDIRDLAFATDSVDVSGSEVSLDAATLAALETITVNQGTSPWTVVDHANTAIENTATSVTDTSAALLASQLAAREWLYVQNNGNREIYIGKSGVTASNGLKLSPGSVADFRLGPAVSMHAVAPTGATVDARLMELS